MAHTLTAEPPANAAARQGSITLIRHGEPALSRKVLLNAEGYRKFWAQYEVLGLLPGQTPPAELVGIVAAAGSVISSTRLRSIESAQALTGGDTFVRDPMLIEAPLPPPRLLAFVRLSPRIWGFMARFWWWFFNHHEGAETRREAEGRADRAAARLIETTASGQDVAVIAHGFFNFMIGRALKRRGWRLAASQGYKYWSMRRFHRA
ncbi:histidine phosphatase family protein [Phenylobacterium sp.]|uniref:histidine phosphatase family protein n=1 Tax=Phenylobacterium sp. TaxID=1871053 RepID=UPI002735D797|nr:histidine phosphatase family protein [Phenylobacterium sp.]MDP3659550.1 histidine phosphatase family protein [Phenylobacterium sp.]